MKRLFATVPLAAALAAAIPANADDLANAAFGYTPLRASVLSDALMADLRGKFVTGESPLVLASPPAALKLPALVPASTIAAPTPPTVPSVNPPAIGSPTIAAPNALTAPMIDAPAINAPAITAPTINAPAINPPTVNAPVTPATPAIGTPAISAPLGPVLPTIAAPVTNSGAAPSTAAALPNVVQNTAPAVSAGPNVAASNASPSLGGGAQVVYFGLNLATTWTAKATDGSNTTYTAGALFGVSLSGGTPKLTIQTTSGKSGTGTPEAGTGNATIGSINDGRLNGVAQAIQTAGNGNAIANLANVDVSTVTPNFVLAAGGAQPCGGACSVSVAAGSLGLKVQLPGGAVSQGIGSGGLYQTAQVTSSYNSIANMLGLHVQVSNPSSHAITPPGFSYSVLRPPSLLGGH